MTFQEHNVPLVILVCIQKCCCLNQMIPGLQWWKLNDVLTEFLIQPTSKRQTWFANRNIVRVQLTCTKLCHIYRFVYAAALFESNACSVLWHFTPFPRNLCLSQLPCAKDSPWDPWDPHQRSAAAGVPGLRLSWWATLRALPSSTLTGLSVFYQPTSAHCLPLCLLVGKLFRCHLVSDIVTNDEIIT